MRVGFRFRVFSWVLPIVAMALSSTAYATEYCYGKITNVAMYADGTVLIVGTWRGDYTTICSTQGTWGGIPAETCMAWYGAALKARADNTNVVMYYPNTNGATCSNIPTYGGSPAPGYLMLYTG